jgi:hypothetical protein
MQMPSSVRVGTQLFTIVEHTRKEDSLLNEGNYAYTQDQFNRIVIDKELSKSKKQTTVMHELFHACWMVFDTSVKPKPEDPFETWEHYFIGIYESSLLLLLKANPELSAWLLED